ncbi:methyltransferase domain-containing protein [Candidatus Saccharibacteria bacterium]|nr:methyltransferase domain-containing protein [Candidatus Saccharibacteria bacterium]NIW79204.1 methyltransferase domain-containing protein [Calditrichia bacterium]
MHRTYDDEVISVAQNYYNSDDADNFYYTIWGGEDIHIGTYESTNESIFDASRRTVENMVSQLKNLDDSCKVLDLGAGYGGAARYLAKHYGCQVVALNLSEAENKRNRQKNQEQNSDHLIEVLDANFEDVPYPDNSFDVVWSQDSFLHSPNREQVLAEAARVLKSGGEFVFTDPMMSDNCPEGVLQPILDRIHLESLASPKFYREVSKKLGLEEISFKDHTQQLVNHYSRVLEETEKNETELRKNDVSEDYISNMKKGLQHWINGGQNGYLTWGIFNFKKK